MPVVNEEYLILGRGAGLEFEQTCENGSRYQVIMALFDPFSPLGMRSCVVLKINLIIEKCHSAHVYYLLTVWLTT